VRHFAAALSASAAFFIAALTMRVFVAGAFVRAGVTDRRTMSAVLIDMRAVARQSSRRFPARARTTAALHCTFRPVASLDAVRGAVFTFDRAFYDFFSTGFDFVEFHRRVPSSRFKIQSLNSLTKTIASHAP